MNYRRAPDWWLKALLKKHRDALPLQVRRRRGELSALRSGPYRIYRKNVAPTEAFEIAACAMPIRMKLTEHLFPTRHAPSPSPH